MASDCSEMRSTGRVKVSKRQRWAKYPVDQPENHSGHERSWTSAPGIWFCYECGHHFVADYRYQKGDGDE